MTKRFLGLLFGLVAMPHVAGAVCAGDCGVDGNVTVDEILQGVNIALGTLNVAECQAMDGDDDLQVTVDEIITAVGNALNGCNLAGEYDGTVEFDAGQRAELSLSAGRGGTLSGTLIVRSGVLVRGLQKRDVRLPPGVPVSLSGSFDPATGAFEVTGTYRDQSDAVHVIVVRGSLPGPNRTAAVQIQVDSEVFPATITGRSGTPPTPRPTPTATATATQPVGSTPTPVNRPTSPPGCPGGYAHLTFSESSGVNSYRNPFNGSLDLFKAEGALTVIDQPPVYVVTAGGTFVTCPISFGDQIFSIQWTLAGLKQIPAAGSTYQLFRGLNFTDQSKPLAVQVDYKEVPSSNPLGTRGWRSDSGTMTIDEISGDTVRVSVDALMSPEVSFSLQTPATGTFRLRFSGTVDQFTGP